MAAPEQAADHEQQRARRDRALGRADRGAAEAIEPPEPGRARALAHHATEDADRRDHSHREQRARDPRRDPARHRAQARRREPGRERRVPDAHRDHGRAEREDRERLADQTQRHPAQRRDQEDRVDGNVERLQTRHPRSLLPWIGLLQCARWRTTSR
jgi:hypothetical protein